VAHRETKLEKDIKRRLKAFGGPLMKKRIEWLHPVAVVFPIEASLLLNQLQWSRLRTLGTKTRAAATSDLAAMANQQREWGLLWNDVQRMKRRIEERWQAPKTLPNWDEIRARMIDEAADRGLTAAQVEQGLRTFANATASDAMRAVESPTVLFGRQLEFAATSRGSALAASDIAESVARLNLTAGTNKPATTVAAKSSAVAASIIGAIYAAFRTGRPRDVVAQTRKVESETNRTLRVLVDAAAYYATHDSGLVDMDAGRHAIEIGRALRATFFARALARAASWVAKWPADSPYFVEWQAAASSRSFESQTVTPDVTPISTIVTSPSAFDGELVTIEGKVGPISIIHRAQKAISSTTLTDGTGAHARVGLTHIKIDSGGLVIGAYAKITGRFSTNHDDFESPVLVPDRRNLTDASATSWFDWVALRLLPVLFVTPHNLAIETSWSVGRDGPGNPLRYRTWASHKRRRIHVD
jgi:hypothetical protein